MNRKREGAGRAWGDISLQHREKKTGWGQKFHVNEGGEEK